MLIIIEILKLNPILHNNKQQITINHNKDNNSNNKLNLNKHKNKHKNLL